MSRIVILAGQSNIEGQFTLNVPVGIPTSAVRYCRWPTAETTDHDTGPIDLQVYTDGHFGCECQLGLDLLAAGWTDLTILKICRDGGSLLDFTWPSGQFSGRWRAVFGAGRPATAVSKAYLVWGNGEAEAAEVTEDSALAYGSRYNVLHAQTEALVGRSMPKILVRFPHPGADPEIVPWADTVRAQIETTADHMIDIDDLATDGNLHLLQSGQNTMGSRIATVLLGL